MIFLWTTGSHFVCFSITNFTLCYIRLKHFSSTHVYLMKSAFQTHLLIATNFLNDETTSLQSKYMLERLLSIMWQVHEHCLSMDTVVAAASGRLFCYKIYVFIIISVQAYMQYNTTLLYLCILIRANKHKNVNFKVSTCLCTQQLFSNYSLVNRSCCIEIFSRAVNFYFRLSILQQQDFSYVAML